VSAAGKKGEKKKGSRRGKVDLLILLSYEKEKKPKSRLGVGEKKVDSNHILPSYRREGGGGKK